MISYVRVGGTLFQRFASTRHTSLRIKAKGNRFEGQGHQHECPTEAIHGALFGEWRKFDVPLRYLESVCPFPFLALQPPERAFKDLRTPYLASL